MILKPRSFLVVVLALLPIPGNLRAAPDKARATITVEATYPGANAQTVADTIAAPIEQQVNGVERQAHLWSRCTDDGTYTLTVTFERGMDPNIAQALVQNRVALAQPILPALVQQRGVTVKKRSPDVRMVVTLSSPHGRYDTFYLSNYAALQLKDELAAVPGAGEVTLVGQCDFALRAWIDPQKLAARGLTADDVAEAVKQQNVAVAPGKFGRPPGGKDFSFTVTTLGRLTDPEQFSNLILKAVPGGGIVRLKDVARIDLGTGDRQGYALCDGKPVVALVIYPTGPERPEKLGTLLQEQVARLRAKLPEGLALAVAVDFTPTLEAPGKPTTPEFLLLDPSLPAAASQKRILELLGHCTKRLRRVKGVQSVLILSENPFALCRDRPCTLVRLAPPGKRGASREQLVRTIRTQLKEVRDVSVRLRDLSSPDDRARFGYPIDLAVVGPDRAKVKELAKKLTERLRQGKKLTDVGTSAEIVPRRQLYLDVDRARATKLGVSLEDVANTLQVTLGSLSVNDFNRFGRTWRATVALGKKDLKDIKLLMVRNARGQMVPLGALVSVRAVEAVGFLYRVDLRPAEEIAGNPAPGVSVTEVRKLCAAAAAEVRKQLRLKEEYRLVWLRDTPGRRGIRD